MAATLLIKPLHFTGHNWISMGHHHHHHMPTGGQSGRLWITISINILITIILFVGGVVSNSLSVISDALHNFSDVVALFVSLFALNLIRRQTSPGRTFGYQRAEIIAALINAGILLVIAGLLCIEALKRLSIPNSDLLNGSYVIYLAIVSIIANALSAFIISGDAKSSLNMRSAYLHLMSDVMSSVAVLIGGFAIWKWQIYWVDSVLAIAIACYLVYSSWGLLMESLKILMQFAPDHLDWSHIKQDLQAFPEILNIHHVHVWQLNDKQTHLEAHIDFHEDVRLSTACAVLERVKETLSKKYAMTHMVLQPEFHACASKELIASNCFSSPKQD